MAERIMVAEDDPALRLLLQTVLEEQGFEVETVSDGESLVRAAHQSLPDLLLIDVMMPVMSGLDAIRQLRHHTRTAHLPMLLLTALDTTRDAVVGFDMGADDYITKPFDNDVLVARIKANLRRNARSSVNSPLTGLPGNVLINAEVSHRLREGEPFALMYIDLNNFKSFNDAYGFARGDRVIRLVADLLRDLRAASTYDHEFIGHIGGDDFVTLVTPDAAAHWSQTLIAQFDGHIPQLYDPQDRARGYLVGIDRFGTPHRFPPISVSIGIVDTSRRRFTSYAEIATVAAEAKGRAKKLTGSRYVFDERQHQPADEPLIERRGQPPLLVVVADAERLQDQAIAWSVANGCRVLVFATLPTATQLQTTLPDLVLVDLQVPEAWAWLMTTRAAYPALPIVALTHEGSDQARALQAGATVCFPLAVPFEVVAQALARFVRPNATPLNVTMPATP